MKKNVSRGKASILMVIVISILLTVLPLKPYFPSTNSADATSGRIQTSEDLGKEEQEGRDDDIQTSDDLGKEEQDAPQVVGQDAPDNEESGEIIQGDSDVDPELLAELRGGDTIKEGSGTAGEENSEEDPDTLSIEELEDQLRGEDTSKRAPIAISEDNIYIVWWTNETTVNDEVMLRASNDSGATFGDKINLSNTTNTDSVDAKIDSDADSVAVTWWERNQTVSTPVVRVSTDNGATFGPVLELAINGTVGQGAKGGE
jgi:hypothetical protein